MHVIIKLVIFAACVDTSPPKAWMVSQKGKLFLVKSKQKKFVDDDWNHTSIFIIVFFIIQSTFIKHFYAVVALLTQIYSLTQDTLSISFSAFSHLQILFATHHLIYEKCTTLSVRDQMRRDALKNESKRRDTWLATQRNRTPRPSSRASSDVAREEMMMMVCVCSLLIQYSKIMTKFTSLFCKYITFQLFLVFWQMKTCRAMVNTNGDAKGTSDLCEFFYLC